MSTCSLSASAAATGVAGSSRRLAPSEVSISLCAIVSAAFRLRPEDLRSQSRGTADIAFARQVLMYLAHTRLGLTYVVTGGLVGRDRTTARHACRKIEDLREDPHVDLIVDHLERALDVWPGLVTGREPG